MICRSIDSLATLLVEYLRVHPVKPGSAEQLTISVNLFSRWYEGAFKLPFDPATFSESLLTEFLHAMRVERGWVEVTANRKRRDLLTLWKFATKRGLVAAYDHTEVVRFKEPELNPTAWFPEELSAFIAACPLVKHRRKTPGWDWRHDRAIALVIYDTAFRRTACLALRREDLRADGEITARAGTQKTLRDETRSLGPDTLKAVRALPASPDGRLFPFPYGKKAFMRRWKKILRVAQLAATRKDGPQKMRRTSATWFEVACPGSAQEHLGHKAADLARKSYLDRRIVGTRKAHRFLPRIASPQGKLF